ncbi:hypothetical protein F2Q69_00058680 [Brassica cretica]|uniref:Uncharacterized protein n=1 Tax=Brassica cretica TaxID=69181 RepID=A0A8S9RHW6_BRACR|nr:hypothetical protein F2Q69_00058680 [Brassica cretica]
MDPNQTIGTTQSRINDVDFAGSDPRTENLSAGASDRTSVPDRTSAPDRTLVPDRTSIPDRTGARVWNFHGESQPTDDLTRTQSTRPISLTPLAQTREEVTELQGMVSTLIHKSRNQETAFRTIVNRLDQAERELAEHRVSARERNQPLTGPSGVTPNPLNLRAFSTPEFPALDPVATWEKTCNQPRNKAWPTEA